jgi:integral membrane protein
MPRTYSGWFRLVAVAEAFSWVGLLVAMVFKYGFEQPLGVTIMGWIHGVVFSAYVVTSLVVFSPLRWRFRVLALALIASVPPLVSVVFERWATRRGLMTPPATTEPTPWRRVGDALRELN